MCGFQGMIRIMAWWLSWLERRPVTAEVDGSSPFRVVCNTEYGILAQLGEHLPYKQGVTGSSPVGPTVLPMKCDSCRCGSMAEQLICNQQVIGSSPIIGFRNIIWGNSRVAKGDRL